MNAFLPEGFPDHPKALQFLQVWVQLLLYHNYITTSWRTFRLKSPVPRDFNSDGSNNQYFLNDSDDYSVLESIGLLYKSTNFLCRGPDGKYFQLC